MPDTSCMPWTCRTAPRRTLVPWSSTVQCRWIRIAVPFEPTRYQARGAESRVGYRAWQAHHRLRRRLLRGLGLLLRQGQSSDLSVGLLHDMRKSRHCDFWCRISESGLHLPRARRGYLASGARAGCRRRWHGLFLHRQQGAHRQERLHDPAEHQSLRNVLQRGWLSCARVSVRPKVCRGPDTCIAHEARNRKLFDVNESLIQLDPRKGLRLTGWFRPANWDEFGVDGLEMSDLDLGGSGPVLIPGTTRLIGGGKQGVLYLLDTAQPRSPCIASLTNTCLSPASPNPVQSFQVAPPPPPPNEYYRQLFGGPVIWSRPANQGGSLAFVWRENDYLRSYPVSDKFEGCDTNRPAPTTSQNCPSSAQSTDFVDRHPGGILALSADGVDASTAIVWASVSG